MKEFWKKIAFRYTKFGAPRYEYNLEPAQLAEIVSSLNLRCEHTGDINIFEIGVARGMTTRFIAEHLNTSGYEVNFFCLDTFSSFTENDKEYEIKNRGKLKHDLIGFAYNDFSVWKNNFKKYSFVKPLKCDAGDFDFSKIEGGVDFIFLDVDLYQPTIKVLRNCKSYLNDGAIILVDDVRDNNRWDGSYEAFFDFVKEEKLDYEIIGNKCGKIVWKTD